MADGLCHVRLYVQQISMAHTNNKTYLAMKISLYLRHAHLMLHSSINARLCNRLSDLGGFSG